MRLEIDLEGSLNQILEYLPNGFPIAIILVYLLYIIIKHVIGVKKVDRALNNIRSARYSDCFIFGHVFIMLKGRAPWEQQHNLLMNSKEKHLKFRIIDKYVIYTRDLEFIKRIFQTEQRLFFKDVDFAYYTFLPILGTGLVTSDGALWQKQRLLMSYVLRVEILDEVVIIARQAVERLAEKLNKFRRKRITVNIEEEFRLLTLQVIGYAILSLSPEECDRTFPELYLPTMTECNLRALRRWRTYLPTASFFRHKDRIRRLDEYIKSIIKKRWKLHQYGYERDTDDILDRIIKKLIDDKQTLTAATVTQICFEIKSFLLAGHETSAAMLTWSLYELMLNPKIMSKVKKEAKVLMGRGDRHPTKNDVLNMKFTLAVFKETLRKYSIVPVVSRRTAIDSIDLDGNKLPKSTTILISISGVHETEYYKPHIFMPKRFLPGGEYERFEEPTRPYKFLPFIQGPRNCLGQHFSLLEARVVLGYLVRKFEFTLASKKPVQKTNIIPEGPKDGLFVYVN